jgi:ubiquinone biosynthesis protein COQ9
MAEGRGRRAGRRAAQAVVSDTDRIIDAALTLTVAQGWRNVSLAAVANEANLPILQVYRIFSSKSAILCGLSRRIDAAVLAAPIEAETGERPRDRVFDLLMRRDLPFDPLSAVAAGAALLCSMRLMLEAAGIACSGIGGVISVKLVAATYVFAAQTWGRDDSPDLAPTMAVLDRRLRAIERFLAPRRAAGSRREAEA